jgi:hypothetical protein
LRFPFLVLADKRTYLLTRCAELSFQPLGYQQSVSMALVEKCPLFSCENVLSEKTNIPMEILVKFAKI